MGCYIISLAAACIIYFIRRKKDSPELKMLNAMFIGGSLFGIIDHIWNNDSFSFSYTDMLLGTAIAFAILGIWIFATYRHKVLRLERWSEWNLKQ